MKQCFKSNHRQCLAAASTNSEAASLTALKTAMLEKQKIIAHLRLFINQSELESMQPHDVDINNHCMFKFRLSVAQYFMNDIYTCLG